MNEFIARLKEDKKSAARFKTSKKRTAVDKKNEFRERE